MSPAPQAVAREQVTEEEGGGGAAAPASTTMTATVRRPPVAPPKRGRVVGDAIGMPIGSGCDGPTHDLPVGRRSATGGSTCRSAAVSGR